MAFKVKILSVLLFICLIDSLHSASYRRMKRDADEEATKEPEKTEESSDGKTESPGSESTTKKSWFNNIGQILNVNEQPDWMKEASSWFNNAQTMFGRN